MSGTFMFSGDSPAVVLSWTIFGAVRPQGYSSMLGMLKRVPGARLER